MIKDLRENDLGFMVGTFYSSIFKYDIEVLFDRDISLGQHRTINAPLP